MKVHLSSVVVVIVAVLAGCGGGDRPPGPAPSTQPPTAPVKTTMQILSATCVNDAALADDLGVELDTPIRVDATAWTANVALHGPRGEVQEARGEDIRPCDVDARSMDVPAGAEFVTLEGVDLGDVVIAPHVLKLPIAVRLVVVGTVELRHGDRHVQMIWGVAPPLGHAHILVVEPEAAGTVGVRSLAAW